MTGVPPIPLTNRSTWSPSAYGRSSTIAVSSVSTMASAGCSLTFSRPGSPWIPMPSSISSSPSSNDGSPECGTVHGVSATPIERTWRTTFSATAVTSSRESPRSAAAPAIFSTRTVPATPRRPAVKVESFTATSSSTITERTSMSSAAASSAAVSKLSTSPV